MTDSSTDAIRNALRLLENEAVDLNAQLKKVNTAIDAIRPLAGLPDETPSAKENGVAASNASLADIVLPPGARSVELAVMTQAVRKALAEAKRPLAVREIAEVLAADGLLPDDSRKLTDLLYRKSRPGEIFERVGMGLYTINTKQPSDDFEF